MLGMYTHAPDLTEIGNLYGMTADHLRETEAKIRTQWAIATTTNVEGKTCYPKEEKVFRAHGWELVGHKFNQYHGPRFIELWAKEFPDAPGIPAKETDFGKGIKRGYC